MSLTPYSNFCHCGPTERSERKVGQKMVERWKKKPPSSAFHGWMVSLATEELLDRAIIMYNPLLDNNCFAYVQPSHCVYMYVKSSQVLSEQIICAWQFV